MCWLESAKKSKKRLWNKKCHAIHQYAAADNKCIKQYKKDDESSCIIMYLDANNLYGWAMIIEQFLLKNYWRFVDLIFFLCIYKMYLISAEGI